MPGRFFSVYLTCQLKRGRFNDADRREEGKLIAGALKALPPQRVFSLFATVRERRVNNRRTRATIRKYLTERPDTIFDAVKYRGKVRAAISHAHLKFPGELGAFLFDFKRQTRFETVLPAG